MDNEKGYVSSRPNGVRDACGTGNVIVPKDKDREKYIAQCFRKGMISITLENGGIVDNVQITKSAIQDLEFPVDYRTLGSQVIWINKPRQNQPLIVGIFNKSNEFVNVDQYKGSLRKSSSKGVSEIIVDSDKGLVLINSSSVTESGGDIYIISTNKKNNSKLNVKVSGNVSIETPDFSITNSKKLAFVIKDSSQDDKVTSIIYERNVGFSYKDEFGNEYYINKENINFKPIGGKFKIGEGAQPILLGDDTKNALILEQKTLTTLIETIKTAPVVAGDGGASFKAALITALSLLQRGDYSNILSKVLSTD